MGNNNIPNRDNWYFGGSDKPLIKDKPRLIEQYIRYMLIKTQQMFEYKNLPDYLPPREIELICQTCKFVIWKKVDDKLYVFYGGIGGLPNEYYQPTTAIVVNPFLKYNKMLTINTDNDDAVIMWNDSLHIGLMPLNEKYASLLAETDISLRFACVNARVLSYLIADNDNTKASMEQVLQDVDDGVKLGVIGAKTLLDNSKSLDNGKSSSNNIKDLIELHQYLKASWFNELGINSNYNMKREAINENEASMNDDALLPMIDDMLLQRKNAIKKVNEMFGTSIEVDLSSAWKKKREEIQRDAKLEQAQIENAGSNEENKPDENETPEKKDGEEDEVE